MRLTSLIAGALLMLAPAAAQSLQADPPPDHAQALAEVDVDRLLRDRDYAGAILGHIVAVDETADQNAEVRAWLDNIRLLALTTLERRDEALVAVDRILQRRPRAAPPYAGPWYATLRFDDFRRAASVAATAAVNSPASEWAALREMFDVQTIWSVIRELRSAENKAAQVELAEAMLRIGWPGTGERQSADSMRRIVLDDRLERGAREDAAGFAASISTPDGLLPLLLLNRYDGMLGDRDPLELLGEALAEEDRETAEAIAIAPDNHKRVLQRASHLRSVGRNGDVIALLEPFTADVAATAAASDEGLWLINEAAYALVAEGRDDEAVALMGRLAELSIDENSNLINTAINYGEILFETGRPQQALDHSLRLEQESGDHASDYGDMWIADTIVCALAALGRAPEATPWLERMRGLSDSNPAALTHAYLCLGDDDAAAELMVDRLGKDDPIGAVLALQDYERSRGTSQAGPLQDRLVALRDRPEVRAALDRVGRIRTLPLARAYWGNF